MRATVSIDARGRMTVPAEVRRELGIEGEATLILETENGRLIAQAVPDEDAWAYTPEHLEKVRRALEDYKAGRVFRLTREELERHLGIQGEEEDADA